MLYAIARELHAALQAQHVPIPVVFGPDVVSVGIDERIVMDYAGQNSDSIEGPTSQHFNPKMPLRLIQGGRIRIYARSPIDGAAWHDHTERAARVLSHVAAELDFIVKKRRNVLAFGPCGFGRLEDEEGAEVTTGAIYDLTFTIDRAILRQSWEGDGLAEVAIGAGVGLKSTTKVSNGPGPAGTPPADAETAC